jgi:dTDP-4-dehydrorhamnose reductase
MNRYTSRACSLVVGATGQVGRQILLAVGIDRCLPTARKPISAGWLALDLATINREFAGKLLGDLALEAIYCVGGMTDVERCETERDLAMRTNCSGPQALAEVANERNIPFIYFSTEYIFDGACGPYNEESIANPISCYGMSKLHGELAVAASCPHALILRTTVVYGPDDAEKNFLYSLRRALAAGRSFLVPEDQTSTPTYNRDLANAALRLVEGGATGVFNVCGPELFSRLEFARRAARFWDFDSSSILGVPTASLGQRAPRPLNAGLSIEKLRHEYPDIRMRDLPDSLSDWGAVEVGHKREIEPLPDAGNQCLDISEAQRLRQMEGENRR